MTVLAKQAPEAPVRFTPRQEEILTCLAAGLSASETADHLGLCYNTVRHHLATATEAAGARSWIETVVRHVAGSIRLVQGPAWHLPDCPDCLVFGEGGTVGQERLRLCVSIEPCPLHLEEMRTLFGGLAPDV